MIPYGRQSIDEDDIAAVVAVLRGDFLTQGPAVEEFEARLCEVTGARYAVAVSSGTAALHAAVAAAGIGTGDVVATSPLTFAASSNAARYVGADVRFVDIDESTWNLDLSLLPPTGVEALVAVHYAGLPLDLRHLPNRPRVVIEDAAHAIGALTPDGPVGNCAHSDMCCFSFHPVKTVTTGEGGAVTTNSAELAERLRRFRHHGVARIEGAPFWRTDIVDLGYNYRLTDLQAALGTSQLGKLERFVVRRNEIAATYRTQLAGLAEQGRITLPPAAPDGFRHGHHLFPVRVADRDRVFDELRERGIGVQVHYIPTYHFTSFAGTGDPADFDVTEAVAADLVSLPIHPSLTDDDVSLVAKTLTEVLR